MPTVFAAAKSRCEVLGRAEELAAEDAEVFPHAVAVEEPVVERADPGVGLVDERPLIQTRDMPTV